jgi:hypothetical protein
MSGGSAEPIFATDISRDPSAAFHDPRDGSHKHEEGLLLTPGEGLLLGRVL